MDESFDICDDLSLYKNMSSEDRAMAASDLWSTGSMFTRIAYKDGELIVTRVAPEDFLKKEIGDGENGSNRNL